MKGLATTYFIVKVTDIWNDSNTKVIRNEIEIIDSYKNCARAKKHFHKTAVSCRDDFDRNETFYMDDNYAVIINLKKEIRLYLTYDILKWI